MPFQDVRLPHLTAQIRKVEAVIGGVFRGTPVGIVQVGGWVGRVKPARLLCTFVRYLY
jgi:hypothetical protein